MAEKPVISVIIPVYNAARFIGSCIDSIIAQQSNVPFEIVCVNDGSSDNSLEILNSYKSSYNNIKVISQVNQGVTAARKKGVDNSEGEWITFVDADDKLTPDALNILAKTINPDNDIIIFEGKNTSYNENIAAEQYRFDIIRCRISSYPWGKLFKRSVFNPETFDTPRQFAMGEDLLMNVKIAFYNNRTVKVTGEKIYIYNPVPTSVSHTFKRTPEYEKSYHEFLSNSLPLNFRNQLDFIHALIYSRINAWKYINFYNLSTKENRASDFYKELVNDIRHYGYPLKFNEKLQVFGTTFISRLGALFFNFYPLAVRKIKKLF